MDPQTNPYRLLPKVEELLLAPETAPLVERVGRDLLTRFIQEVLERWRGEIRDGKLDAAGLEKLLAAGELLARLETRVRREEGSGLCRAINATGVVLHTGLGRAPVHPEAARAMAEAAGGFCVLEVERFSGARNQRDDRLGELVCRLTGAEAGICVNNNAAAVLLTLSTFAAGRETIVSRGELVEIGGSFRIPEVMERAGTKLVEVGTTNRTRLDDYRRGANERTGLLLKVHSSNYRMIGFTEEVHADELTTLGNELGIPAAFDLGSGLLETEGLTPLPSLGDEPRVRDVVASGIDVVTFSGDKLLGAPQAGFVVGKRAAIAAMRANAMYRALRLDKVTIAGLERTLELLLAGRGDEIPARAMLGADAATIRVEGEKLSTALAAVAGFDVELIEGESQPGSGSAPGVYLPTWVVRVRARSLSSADLAARLRANDPPVFARIQDDALLFDPRTLFAGDRELLVAALTASVGERG